ncbi:unnamed protein product [Durusdinium trenchii]|uniref:Dystroglycan-type cadherin-like domain-containing protein n=1 Tax=Durusdinium trenchii TaxID=1381693 RepID=A0ABP0PGM0_9DINO
MAALWLAIFAWTVRATTWQDWSTSSWDSSSRSSWRSSTGGASHSSSGSHGSLRASGSMPDGSLRDKEEKEFLKDQGQGYKSDEVVLAECVEQSSGWSETLRRHCCEAMGLGCGVSLAAAVSTGVSSLELPAVTVVVGKEFEVPVGTFLGQEVTLLVDGEPPHNWLQFNEKHGSLLGRVGAPGSWRISLRAKGDEELPSAHLELFAVDPLHSPSTPAGAPFEEANARPFLVQSVPDIWTKVGQNFQQAVPATSIVDPSGAPLLLTARLKSGSPLPLWLSFDPSTRTFRGKPPYEEDLQISLHASNAHGAMSTSLGLHATDGDRGPSSRDQHAVAAFRGPDVVVPVGKRFVQKILGSHGEMVGDGLLSRCRHPIPSSILVPSEDDQSPGLHRRDERRGERGAFDSETALKSVGPPATQNEETKGIKARPRRAKRAQA